MKNGFTLIECIISLVLLAITMASSMAFYFYSNGYQAQAIHRRIAADAANSKLEEIKDSGYANLPNPAPAAGGLWLGPENIAIAGLTGQQEVYVFDIDENGDTITDYKMIQDKISWDEAQNTVRQEVSLETYMVP